MKIGIQLTSQKNDPILFEINVKCFYFIGAIKFYKSLALDLGIISFMFGSNEIFDFQISIKSKFKKNKKLKIDK